MSIAIAFLSGLQLVLLAVMLVGMFTQGNRLWVRRMVPVMLVLAAAQTAGVQGPWEAIRFLVVTVAMSVVATVVILLLLRLPRVRVFGECPPESWPEHARRDIDRWTREFAALGFQPVGDREQTAQVATATMRTSVRFLTHASAGEVATLFGIHRPGLVGRSLVSLLADGRVLVTSDQTSDAASIPEPATIAQRMPSHTSSLGLLEAHRATLGRLGGEAVRPDDPIAAYALARDRWLERVVAAGLARIDGDSVRLTWKALPGSIGRTLREWLM